MPEAYAEISFRSISKIEYQGLSPVDENSIYFLNDTNQIFVGSKEYTTSALVIEKRPTQDDEGSEGRFYVCTEDGSSYVYIGHRWISVYDPTAPTVKTITAGECISCNPNPITNEGTVSHGTPQGAKETSANTDPIKAKFGESFNVTEVSTDKFGHVVSFETRSITLPGPEELTTVFKFKGTVNASSDLPQENNVVGDVYYVIEDSAEYVYMESGWEKLGPVIDLSGYVPRVEGAAGYVPKFDANGYLVSSGYLADSGVVAGKYGGVSEDSSNVLNIPSLTLDSMGRATYASNVALEIADPKYVEDCIAWIYEQHLG